MNSVDLVGRLTRDPEVRYTSGTQMAVCTFNIAIDRATRSGEEKKADFPRVKVFGKQAEVCGNHLKKGNTVAVQGRLETDNYTDKNGNSVFMTEVVASKVDFLIFQPVQNQQPEPKPEPKPQPEPTQESFEAIDEEVPF